MSKTIFFPSNTLIYGISRDGSKNFNIHTCEYMILGQLTMGAHQTKNATLQSEPIYLGIDLVKIVVIMGVTKHFDLLEDEFWWRFALGDVFFLILIDFFT